MREILFRGRTWEGEWVYGSFIDGGSEAFIWKLQPIRVNPDTVGQYTELKDKNGKEIYEGDIVKIWIDGYECIAVIAWSPPCFWALIHKAPEDSGISEGMASGFVSHHTEVIGNIHEDPEL